VTVQKRTFVSGTPALQKVYLLGCDDPKIGQRFLIAGTPA
jgi:hypothetical protein